MNSKGTYIDPSISSSSYPSSSFSNFLNPKNFNIPNQWNSTTPINTNSLYGMNNMNGLNMNNMNGLNMNNMNGFNMNHMNGYNMNNMNGFNMNGMNTSLNQQQNSGMNMNMNMNNGYGTLSQSIPQTFSSRNNNYNASDYINENFVNKNYKTHVNDLSNLNQQSTYEPMQSNYTNQNMTIKRNKKDFIDAKASIQSKVKKNNLENNEIKNENENETYILRNTNFKNNVKIVDDKKQHIENNEDNNVKKLINEIINIIHS